MTFYRLEPTRDPGDLREPVIIVAFDSWVDAGAASTSAAGLLVEDAPTVARFDPDALFDYRARRPTLEIVDGRPRELTWPELTLRRASIGGRDLLVLVGPEPDYRWRELAEAAVELARELGVVQWISLGAIPAAVPHTRAVPVIGTASEQGLLRGDVEPGPEGILRVPAACISVLDMAVTRAGTPAVGYFAQVPHYISGPYAPAALALSEALGRHLGVELPQGALAEEARELRERLDAATGLDETTRTYVQRLEAMYDEARLPSGDDLIADIERFLRERSS
ncbi:MAG TPA: PAC2 family protein [Candidatus Limnocylindrales bacterium]|nr:PAC2 family protein [Candidatus Limnocylindrales bacterium]